MIKIQKPKISDLSCFVCQSKEDVMEIYFRHDYQGNCIALCKKCRDELVSKIQEAIRKDGGINNGKIYK